MARWTPRPELSGRDLVGLGGMLAGAVVVGLVLGLRADRAAGTSPACTLAGIALGIRGGCRAFGVRVRSVLE